MCLVSGYRCSGFANDSYGEFGWEVGSAVSRRHYVTTKRLESLRASLSQRDWAILNDIDRLGIMSGGQLRIIHYAPTGLSRRQARMDLSELVNLEVLQRLGRRIGGEHSGSDGYCYAIGLAGQRLIDPDRRRTWRIPTPGPALLSHATAVSQLYVELQAAASGPTHLAGFDAEPACWRRYFGPGGSPQWLKPDAYVAIESDDYEDRYFIEVDCATEFPARIVSKARAYISYWQSGREQSDDDIFPIIAFVVPTATRKAQLVDALSRLPAEHWRLFVVTTSDRASEALLDGSLLETAHEESVS